MSLFVPKENQTERKKTQVEPKRRWRRNRSEKRNRCVHSQVINVTKDHPVMSFTSFSSFSRPWMSHEFFILCRIILKGISGRRLIIAHHAPSNWSLTSIHFLRHVLTRPADQSCQAMNPFKQSMLFAKKRAKPLILVGKSWRRNLDPWKQARACSMSLSDEMSLPPSLFVSFCWRREFNAFLIAG